MRMTFDGFDAKTITLDEIDSLQNTYGYNENEELNEFISTIYLQNNPNFSYVTVALATSSDFQEYYDENFIYDFDEWSCISWFIDKENVFHSVCLDEDTFMIAQRKLTPQDNAVMQEIRSEFGQWEIKI